MLSQYLNKEVVAPTTETKEAKEVKAVKEVKALRKQKRKNLQQKLTTIHILF